MRIRYDVTPAATTVYCDCGWRELTLRGRDGARRIAAQHEHDVHPESRQVREANRIRELRQKQQQRSASDVRIREDDGGHGD